MEFVLIGPGQLGQLLLRQAGRDCLVIGQDADSTRQIGELYGCPWTTKIERAAEGEVIAVVIPASAVPSVLNFATAVDIPQNLREKRPDLVWSEAKLVGSAVGMAHGLPCMIVLGEHDPALLRRVQNSLPGLADQVTLGDAALVPGVNRAATEAALRAVIALERELSDLGVPRALIDAALGGTVPGVSLSYQRGTLGGFARKIVQQIEEEG